ncbi:phosphoglycerate dehydrogenase [Nocardioides mangrovicus]|uniref:D-3-phosphoglycerate dehydrogenase n=1 Tax=Nocardioides mangrovicus TaxID=2478913 RepID=A0A3L8P150_9ACTN|nr:phosphoglycerate dehydrogenase [Nocardioides mangrovicus]RLV49176.1 phosphoglycerate dehydrogenase [Nocardioides mangrovicus]
MTKALLLENVHPCADEVFAAAGIEVERVSSSLAEQDLIAALPGVDLLGIRSNTHLTERVLDSAPQLAAVGAFCIGTNQIDKAAAARRGIAAFNAPYSNTRSVVELVIGEIIALARRLVEKTDRMHAGVWDKSAKGSHEIRGRVLGIVGYGNIGSQLSVVAEAVGLRVIFYDVNERLAHGNAERVRSLEELLERSDVVTLHVDGRPGNAGIFGPEQFDRMKPRSIFINASRGMVVDDEALRERLLTGHISGAAIDVFPIEPKAQGEPFESPLRGLDNVILTPHVGGSTQEAQEEIGRFVSGKLVSFLHAGNTALSVDLPEVQTPPLAAGALRIAHLHVNVPGVLAEINRVLSEENLNVVAQNLATLGEQGYVVTDVVGPVAPTAVEKLQAMSQTIWLRTHTA